MAMATRAMLTSRSAATSPPPPEAGAAPVGEQQGRDGLPNGSRQAAPLT